MNGTPGFGILFRKSFFPTVQDLASKSKSQENKLTSVFFKCLCTPGYSKEITESFHNQDKDFKKYEDSQCEEVPLSEIGERVQKFLENWDTKEYSDFEKAQEKRIFKYFFSRPRDRTEGMNNFAISRYKSPETYYSVSLDGPDIDAISENLTPSFKFENEKDVDETFSEAEILDKFEKEIESQKHQLIKSKLLFKEKIRISTFQNFTGTQFYIDCDATQSLSELLQKKGQQLNFAFVHPLTAHGFALAPTIKKMVGLYNYGGIGVRQEYNHLNENGKEN